MVKNKNFKMSKRLLLVLGITLLATTSAYAGYTLSTFKGNDNYNTYLAEIKTSISSLTTRLTDTADKLRNEKSDRSTDISQLNGEIAKANQYAESVSSAVADADNTKSTASAAISSADAAISYDPSTVSSSAN